MNTYHRIVEGDHPAAKPAVASFASPSAVRLVRVSAPAPQDGPSLWPQAKAAMEKGDFATARELLLRAVKIYPRDASLWFHLGASCGELNDVDAAIAAFERARTLDPVNHKQISTWGFCIGAPAIWAKRRRPTGRDWLSIQRSRCAQKLQPAAHEDRRLQECDRTTTAIER